RDRGAGRQGRQGPADAVAAEPGGAAATGGGAGAGIACGGPAGGVRGGVVAACAGAEVSERGARVRLAVCVPGAATLDGPARRRGAAAPCGSGVRVAGAETGAGAGGDCQARDGAHVAAFVRDAPAGGGL